MRSIPRDSLRAAQKTSDASSSCVRRSILRLSESTRTQRALGRRRRLADRATRPRPLVLDRVVGVGRAPAAAGACAVFPTPAQWLAAGSQWSAGVKLSMSLLLLQLTITTLAMCHWMACFWALIARNTADAGLPTWQRVYSDGRDDDATGLGGPVIHGSGNGPCHVLFLCTCLPSGWCHVYSGQPVSTKMCHLPRRPALRRRQ